MRYSSGGGPPHGGGLGFLLYRCAQDYRFRPAHDALFTLGDRLSAIRERSTPAMVKSKNSVTAAQAPIPMQRQRGTTKVMPCQWRSGQSLSQRSDARLVGRRVNLKLDESDTERVECTIKAAGGGRCLVFEPGSGRQVWFPAPSVRKALLPEVDHLCDSLAGMPVGSAATSAEHMALECDSGDGSGSPRAGPLSRTAPPFSSTASAAVAELLAQPTTLELALATGSYPPPPRVSQSLSQTCLLEDAECAEDDGGHARTSRAWSREGL